MPMIFPRSAGLRAIRGFVSRKARLRQIDRGWDQLQPHRAVVAELLQNSEQLRHDSGALREYASAEARRVAAERPGERLIPEDLFEAVFPAARAVLLDDTWRTHQTSGRPRRSLP